MKHLAKHGKPHALKLRTACCSESASTFDPGLLSPAPGSETRRHRTGPPPAWPSSADRKTLSSPSAARPAGLDSSTSCTRWKLERGRWPSEML
eukprot:5667539-Pyramimonas_sp.AAC.1